MPLYTRNAPTQSTKSAMKILKMRSFASSCWSSARRRMAGEPVLPGGKNGFALPEAAGFVLSSCFGFMVSEPC